MEYDANDLLGRRAPKVNKIGGDNPHQPRSNVTMVDVFRNDGLHSRVSQGNARDLLNHGTIEDGVHYTWSQARHKTAADEVDAEQEADEPKAEADDAVKENPLDALRNQLKDLGVEVDQRWGARRLGEEIAKATQVAE